MTLLSTEHKIYVMEIMYLNYVVQLIMQLMGRVEF